MKTIVNTSVSILILLLVSMTSFSQDKVSSVEFEGDYNAILTATSANPSVTGTLSSGEKAEIICAKGVCSIVIDYKGRPVRAEIGDRITIAQVIEYDFGGDEDKELIVINDHKGTSVLYVYAYARGIIQKLYEREIFNNRTVIKENYIEIYSTGGLDTICNYYQGMFWGMKPVEL